MKDLLIGMREGFHDWGQAIQNIINFILLLVSYILGIGLASILLRRIFGRKFLILKPKKKTNWTYETTGNDPRERYYRQF